MTDGPKEQAPAVPFSLEEVERLSQLRDQYLTALGIEQTDAFGQQFGSEVSETDAWKSFLRRYDPDRPDANRFDRLGARKHQQVYRKAGFNIKDGDIDCQWHTEPPPGLQGLKHTIHPPSWQIKWAEGQDDWVILRITKRNPDGSLMLREVIGRRK